MNYFIWYLGIGTIMMILLYIRSETDQSEDAKSRRKINKLLEPKANKWYEKLLYKLILPVFVMSGSIIFWPIVVIVFVKERIERHINSNNVKKEAERFYVKKEHLLKKLEIEQIEILEQVNDPLKSAPNKPFGFLNPEWEEFKKKIQKNDEIWSFSAVWTSEYDYSYYYTGYVLVKSGIPGDFFLLQEVMYN